MPVDYLSLAGLIASILGIYQNIEKRKSSEENVREISLALEQGDRLYLILKESKTIHDNFQDINDGFPLLLQNLQRDGDSIENTLKHMQNFLTDRTNLTMPKSISYPVARDDDEDDQKVPLLAAFPIKLISNEIFPALKTNFAEYFKVLAEVEEKYKSNNIVGIQQEIKTLGAYARQVMLFADKMILEMVPIIMELHSRLSSRIKDIQ